MTSLGSKGYTILKKDLTQNEIFKIKKELTIKPITYNNLNSIIETYPIYRENINKIYVPRYYGLNLFGVPKYNKLNNGTNINVFFKGKLRDYQEDVVNAFMDNIYNNKNTKNSFNEPLGGGGLIQIGCGKGKCLAKNTEILMYDGTIKLSQNIKVGDKLMGDDSNVRNVLSVCKGRDIMYKINYDNDKYYIVNNNHILSLITKNNQKYDISINDYIHFYKNKNPILFGYRVPIYFKYSPVFIDPYLIGYNICSSFFYRIPNKYKYNSHHILLNILAGIIDNNGYYDNKYYIINIKNTKIILINDIIFIIRCLGFNIEIIKFEFTHKIIIKGNLKKIPVKYNHNIIYNNYYEEEDLSYSFNIHKLNFDDYYGFEIDGNRRFVLGDFTVTHNTVCALNIISKIQKKTLIIVHKDFLMNQWIERIQQYLPNSKIGKIQGKIIDIENKDIVLAMLQSISMKE